MQLIKERDQNRDPIELFQVWNQEMLENPSGDSAAMVLSTAAADGVVSSRVVLLKDFGPEGFVFYTNYLSRKAIQLAENRHASLLFYWPNQHQQIRIEGIVEKVSPEESDNYFAERPAGSQLGAWASEQSSEISSRQELDDRFSEFKVRFGNKIPRPPHWGGFLLRPDLFEFWQEGDNRMHDRIEFRRRGGEWTTRRLAP
jgi:pyridoxamine 5'-phosphate oxidase